MNRMNSFDQSYYLQAEHIRGREIGREEGLEEGREEGRAKGREDAFIELYLEDTITLPKLQEKMQLSEEELNWKIELYKGAHFMF